MSFHLDLDRLKKGKRKDRVLSEVFCAIRKMHRGRNRMTHKQNL